jgi:hypothetical protein
MKAKKLITLTMILILAVSVISPICALAANHPYSFNFANVVDSSRTGLYSKSDLEQHWYLSTYNYVGNTLSSSNILGVRMHDTAHIGYVSNYHTVASYTTNLCFDYTTQVSNVNNQFYMGAKKDDSSTSGAALTISGQFCP